MPHRRTNPSNTAAPGQLRFSAFCRIENRVDWPHGAPTPRQWTHMGGESPTHHVRTTSFGRTQPTITHTDAPSACWSAPRLERVLSSSMAPQRRIDPDSAVSCPFPCRPRASAFPPPGHHQNRTRTTACGTRQPPILVSPKVVGRHCPSKKDTQGFHGSTHTHWETAHLLPSPVCVVHQRALETLTVVAVCLSADSHPAGGKAPERTRMSAHGNISHSNHAPLDPEKDLSVPSARRAVLPLLFPAS